MYIASLHIANIVSFQTLLRLGSTSQSHAGVGVTYLSRSEQLLHVLGLIFERSASLYLCALIMNKWTDIKRKEVRFQLQPKNLQRSQELANTIRGTQYHAVAT